MRLDLIGNINKKAYVFIIGMLFAVLISLWATGDLGG